MKYSSKILFNSAIITFVFFLALASSAKCEWSVVKNDFNLISFSPTHGCYLDPQNNKVFVKIESSGANSLRLSGIKRSTLKRRINKLKENSNSSRKIKRLKRLLTLAKRCNRQALFSGDSNFSISRHGISWEGRSVDGRRIIKGTFANGDPWVVGPVEITKITPASTVVAGRTVNGSMINPNCEVAHGYDSELWKEVNGSQVTYRYEEGLNVAWEVSSANPLVITPSSTSAKSLISTESNFDTNYIALINRAAVLTVLSELPDDGSFRPPYGDPPTKSVKFNKSQLRYNLLPKLAPASGSPDISQIDDLFEKVWLDHRSSWPGRYMHPVQNMKDYGREMATEVGVGAIKLIENLPNSEKENLLIRMVQLGIDNYGNLLAGCRWEGVGGQCSGRKFPILLAGYLLNDPEMLNVGYNYESYYVPNATGATGKFFFGEDSQTFYVEQTGPGEYNHGYGGYSSAHVNLPEWGNSHSLWINNDRQGWTADSYRRCCTANGWVGQTIASLALGLKDEWNNPAYFDYMDRYMDVVPQGDWTRSWDPFAENAWDSYRSMYPKYNCTDHFSSTVCQGQ